MVNKVILVGNVGRDPEVRYIDNDVAVASFSLATSETYTDKEGNRQTKTEWHNIVAWRNLAKLAENYIKKGSLIFIEGKLTTRSWQDKEGNNRYTTEVVALNIQLLSRKSDSQSSSQSAPPPTVENAPKDNSNANSTGIEESVDDDLPF